METPDESRHYSRSCCRNYYQHGFGPRHLDPGGKVMQKLGVATSLLLGDEIFPAL